MSLDLIYDRTAEDDSYAGYLLSLEWEEMTDAQKNEWLGGLLKGLYWYTDRNRVEGAAQTLKERLYACGYTANITTVTNWQSGQVFSDEDAARYLNNIKTLRAMLSAFVTTPPAPDTMDALTWQKANDIEKILADIEVLINNMTAAYRHCGTFNCGMGGLRV